MKFTLPYPPSTNNLFATVCGRRVKTAAARNYAATAAAMAVAAGVLPMTGDLAVNIEVYRPRRTGDLDNTLKSVLDSLKGIAWADDSQVVQIYARRHDDKTSPRVVVEVFQKR